MEGEIVKKRVIMIASIILLILLIWLDYHRKIISFDGSKQTIRSEMRALYRSVTIGMPRKQLVTLVSNFVDLNDGYTYGINNGLLELRAPVELPGLTWFWIIYVFFDSDAVIGLAIRPIDGNYRLCDAPLDRGLVPKNRQLTEKNQCLPWFVIPVGF